MRANNKVAKKGFEDLVVGYMNGAENVVKQVRSDIKHANGRLCNVYQAGHQMALAGFFACYYNEAQNELEGLEIKTYDNCKKNFDRYCHFMALAVERLYEANTKTVA